MDGFVDLLHSRRFLRACDPSYAALTFTLVGLPPPAYISLLLAIMFGSFLPSLWSSSNQSLLGSREPTLLCNQVDSWLRLGAILSARSARRVRVCWGGRGGGGSDGGVERAGRAGVEGAKSRK